MVLYHVTTKKKLLAAMNQGFLTPPVRAWDNINAAEYFSKSTGRKIIVRLKKDNTFQRLEGHKGQAAISQRQYVLHDI